MGKKSGSKLFIIITVASAVAAILLGVITLLDPKPKSMMLKLQAQK